MKVLLTNRSNRVFSLDLLINGQNLSKTFKPGEVFDVGDRFSPEALNTSATFRRLLTNGVLSFVCLYGAGDVVAIPSFAPSSSSTLDDSVSSVPFSFESPSTTTLREVITGQSIDLISVLITTPFDPSATIQIGTSANPGMFLALTGSDLNHLSQYDSPGRSIIYVNDLLIMTVSAEASTQGSGFLYYKVRG